MGQGLTTPGTPAPQQLAWLNASSGGVSHDVTSNVIGRRFNGNSVTQADLAAGGAYAFGNDWNRVGLFLAKQSAQLLEFRT